MAGRAADFEWRSHRPLLHGQSRGGLLHRGTRSSGRDVGGARRSRHRARPAAARSARQQPAASGLVTEHEQVRKAEHEQRVLAEALRDITVMLSSSLNLDQVFEGILDQVARVVPYDACTILLIKRRIGGGGARAGSRPVYHRPAVPADGTEPAERHGNRAAGGGWRYPDIRWLG